MAEHAHTPTPRIVRRRRATNLSAPGETAIALAIGAKPSRSKAVATTIPWDMALGEVRTMELQGLTADGRLVKFWDEGYPVRRVDRFIKDRHLIKGGKYLLAYRGHLVTTHCVNGLIGNQPCVTMQIMSHPGPNIFLPREQVEPMLFGYVVPDEVAESKISQLLADINQHLKIRDDTPGRQRGRI